MRVVVAGAGTMGAHVAQELSSEGHDVFVIDRDAERCAELIERTEAMAVTGDALDPDVLSQAEVSRADLLLAVTDRDEINIVLAGLAREMGVERTVARVRGASYSLPQARSLLTKRLEISQIVNPVESSVARLEALIGLHSATEVLPLASGKAFLATFPVSPDCPLKGLKLADIAATPFPEFPLAVAVYRSGRLIIPRGSHTLEENDEAGFILLREYARDFAEWFVPGGEPSRRIVIVGARSIGVHLAMKLKTVGMSVSLVDDDPQECRRAAAGLEGVTVVRGRITEEEVLDEIELAGADYLVAASQDEDYNLIAALWAKRHGVRKAVVVTEHPEYIRLLKSLQVDAAINPRTLAAAEVLRFIRKGIVISVSKLDTDRPGAAEVLEFLVSEYSPIAGRKLSEANLPDEALVGLLLEGDTPVIPHGDTVITPGTRALVFSSRKALKAVQSLFAPK